MELLNNKILSNEYEENNYIKEVLYKDDTYIHVKDITKFLKRKNLKPSSSTNQYLNKRGFEYINIRNEVNVKSIIKKVDACKYIYKYYRDYHNVFVDSIIEGEDNFINRDKMYTNAKNKENILKSFLIDESMVPNIDFHIKTRINKQFYSGNNLLIYNKKVVESIKNIELEYIEYIKEDNRIIMYLNDYVINRYEFSEIIKNQYNQTLGKTVIENNENIIDIISSEKIEEIYISLDEIFKTSLEKELIEIIDNIKRMYKKGIIPCTYTFNDKYKIGNRIKIIDKGSDKSQILYILNNLGNKLEAFRIDDETKDIKAKDRIDIRQVDVNYCLDNDIEILKD